MKDILHSVYIKHDTSFKSLTKRALAQIIIKIIYQYGQKGILSSKLRRKLEELTGIRFRTQDIDDALTRLRVTEDKLNTKHGRHFIKETYKPIIEKAINESYQLHERVMKFWFSKSKTYQEITNGTEVIDKWFKKLLIKFFNEYSYDWINDLRSNRRNGRKKTINIESIIDLSFVDSNIFDEDYTWLKAQFINFIESDRKDDFDLLWIYGSSMFSSTLLTAKNYADDFGLEIFRDSDFILDTNVLMILELEGFDRSYAIKSIENSFKKLNITPKYFYISYEEYLRAIGPKHDATIASLKKYSFDVISNSDCPFIKTALKRKCREVEDFEQFFQEVSFPPSKFGETLDLILDDYKELNEAIANGESNEKIKNEINRIHKRRTNHDKRNMPKQHDAGLIAGAEFIKQNKNCWILTRDGTLREYAYEKTLRDENPIALGLDSLIQMLAINSGGTEISSTNFAPLFGRLVRASLMPEKDTFEMEDLYFIEKTRIQISELPNDKIIEIAKNVNKLRLKGVSDDDIVLEIQRSFQRETSDKAETIKELRSEKDKIIREKEKYESENEKLESHLFEKEVEEEIKKLKTKVTINWIKLIGIPLLITILVYCIFYLAPIKNNLVTILVSILTDIVATLITFYFGKFKLRISRMDKQEINKKVKKKLLELKNQPSR